MRTILWRTLGFAIPTVGLVAALHVGASPGAAAALDGTASGLYFAVLFMVGGLLARIGLLAVRPGGEAFARPAAGREALAGGATALLAWALVWAWWALPQTRWMRAHPTGVFALNSAAMIAAALVLAAWRDRARPPSREAAAAARAPRGAGSPEVR